MFDNMNVQETLGESDREDRDDRKAILTGEHNPKTVPRA